MSNLSEYIKEAFSEGTDLDRGFRKGVVVIIAFFILLCMLGSVIIFLTFLTGFLP